MSRESEKAWTHQSHILIPVEHYFDSHYRFTREPPSPYILIYFVTHAINDILEVNFASRWCNPGSILARVRILMQWY